MNRRAADVVSASFLVAVGLIGTAFFADLLGLPARWNKFPVQHVVWKPAYAWWDAWTLGWVGQYVLWVWALGVLTAQGVFRPLAGVRVMLEVGVGVITVLFATSPVANPVYTGWGLVFVLATVVTATLCGLQGWAVRNRRRPRPPADEADE